MEVLGFNPMSLTPKPLIHSSLLCCDHPPKKEAASLVQEVAYSLSRLVYFLLVFFFMAKWPLGLAGQEARRGGGQAQEVGMPPGPRQLVPPRAAPGPGLTAPPGEACQWPWSEMLAQPGGQSCPQRPTDAGCPRRAAWSLCRCSRTPI